MVVGSSFQEGRVLKFHSGALEDNTLLLVRYAGHEAMSTPYSYTIDLVSEKGDIDAAAVLKEPAWIGVRQPVPMSGSDSLGVQLLRVHGMVETFEQGKWGKNWVAYRAVLRPKLWRLARTTRTKIHLDKTVPEIVTEYLEEAGLTSDDYLFLTNAREYATREYVVQFQETDLECVSRLLESEGIFYYFLQGEERERVVFADSPDVHAPIQGNASMKFDRTEGERMETKQWVDEEEVTAFSLRQTILPKTLILKDRNDDTPSVDLTVTTEVSADGVGTVYVYGDHYKTAEEGEMIAGIRAEELKCREKMFYGEGDGRSFRAGATFDLTNHPREDFNANYVILEAHHWAEQTLAHGVRGSVDARYENEFTAIPAATVYRPARVTPRPKATGVTQAIVDAAGDGTDAELDEQGRYKIKLLQDLSEDGGGTRSLPVAMAQPCVGSDYGMHLPLHKGVAVLVAHIEGNFDRPVMIGGTSDTEHTSPSKDANQTQSIWKSAANNAIVMEDLKDEERFLIRAQRNLEVRVEKDTFERVANDRHLLVKHDRIEKVENDYHLKIDRDQIEEVGGSRYVTLTANEVMDISGKFSLTVAKDMARVCLGNVCDETTGTHTFKSDTVVVDATSGITLVCGGSSVVLDASGVTVSGATITLDGTTTKVNSGSGSSAASAVSVSADVPQAVSEVIEPGDLEAGAATASGSGEAEVTPTEGDTSWISLELSDDQGNPIPQELYQVTLSDGTIVRGRLDKEGKAEVKGISDGDAKITFPRLDQGNWSST